MFLGQMKQEAELIPGLLTSFPGVGLSGWAVFLFLGSMRHPLSLDHPPTHTHSLLKLIQIDFYYFLPKVSKLIPGNFFLMI